MKSGHLAFEKNLNYIYCVYVCIPCIYSLYQVCGDQRRMRESVLSFYYVEPRITGAIMQAASALTP